MKDNERHTVRILQYLRFDIGVVHNVGEGRVVQVVWRLGLVVRVDVRHERVARAVDSLTDCAPVLLVARRVLIGDVPFQTGFRAQHLAARQARENLPQTCANRPNPSDHRTTRRPGLYRAQHGRSWLPLVKPCTAQEIQHNTHSIASDTELDDPLENTSGYSLEHLVPINK